MRRTRIRVFVRVAVSVALGSALVAIIFFDHVRGAASFPFDFPLSYYAATAYWITSVQSGEWPHWLPYQSMGTPFVASPQTGLFYPPFWLFWVSGRPYSLHAANLFQTLHVLAGAGGMALLARTLFRRPVTWIAAGVSFLTFGGLYTNSQHPDIVRAFALTPWVLWTLTLARSAPPSAITRVRGANLLLPLTTGMFITGAYPGAMLAGLPCFALYVVAQAWRDRAVSTARADIVLQLGLLALGVGMAACYLVPTAMVSEQLVRSRGPQEVWGATTMRLLGRDVLGLTFSSQSVQLPPGADWSMKGMQLPITLLPFLAYVRGRRLRELAPALVVGVWASLMAFEAFTPASSMIVRLLPPLGLSRFPTADYRLFVALALLLVALSGIEEYASTRRRPSLARLTGAVAIAGAIVLVGVGLARSVEDDVGRAASFAQLRVQAAALLGVLLVLAGSPARLFAGRRWALELGLAGLMAAAALPVVFDMKGAWSSRSIERRVWDDRGLPLREGEQLRARRIFERHLTWRPARDLGLRRGDLPIRGYVDGSYMGLDLGGAATFARQRVTQDPQMLAFILQPGRLAGAANVEGVGDDVEVDVTSLVGPGTSSPVEYMRNTLAYEVDAPRDLLFVENELYAPGWTGTLEPDGVQVQPVRVNGALRGWRIPAGQHTLRLRYATPGLRLGALISAGSLALWLAVSGLVCRGIRPPHRP